MKIKGKLVGINAALIISAVVLSEAAALANVHPILVTSIVLVIGVAISYVVGDVIAKGFQKITNDLERMAEGDFSMKIDASTVKKKDETGAIAKALINMEKSTGDTIHGITEELGKISEALDDAMKRIDEVHADVEDISATTEELSAGMEETAASLEEMSATSHEIEAGIENISLRAGEGAESARMIKGRAGKLLGETTKSKENAGKVYENTNIRLRKSIERAKSIEQDTGIIRCNLTDYNTD